LCLDRRLVGALEPPNFGHHHHDVTGGVLSFFVCHSQPDIRGLESAGRPHDDLIPSGVIKPKIERRCSPGHHEEVSEQGVGDSSHGADSDEDRRPSVDGRAEDWMEITWQEQDAMKHLKATSSTPTTRSSSRKPLGPTAGTGRRDVAAPACSY
jgi:hypothetical protein